MSHWVPEKEAMASTNYNGFIRFWAVLLLISAAQPIAAGVGTEPVEIANEPETGLVTIVAEHASLDEILEKLAEQFEFNIEHGAEVKAVAAPFSIKVSGTLETVLKRLLRNRNYLIVRSSGDSEKVEKIVILTATEGSPPSKPPAVGVGPQPPATAARQPANATSGSDGSPPH